MSQAAHSAVGLLKKRQREFKEKMMMERFADTEEITMSFGDRLINVTNGIDKLHAIVAEQKSEPGKKQIIDCPICGAKAAMTYVLSPYNGHLHAGCTVCRVSIMQ